MKILATIILLCASALAQTMSVTPSASTVMSYNSVQVLVSEENVKNPNGNWSTNCGTGNVDQNGLFVAPLVAANTPCIVEFADIATGMSASTVITVTPAFDQAAQLPVAVVHSSMADTPTPGVVTQVAPLGLQNALNAANCGDTLLLQAGSTYPGSYKAPAKDCDDQHWIVVRTSAPDSVLPAEGTRINPCYAGVSSLPGRHPFSCPANSVGVTAKIVAAKGAAALTLAPGANHYRIGPGLEITRLAGNGINFGLIVPSNQAAADHIVIDRDWVHGTAQDETVRGVFLSGITTAAVIDSYLSDFHCIAGIGQCTDAQAIAGGTGPLPGGPYKIHNNFLEGAAETILFGGVLKNSATPTDITITRNNMYKPLTWMPGQAGFVGGVNTDVTKCLKTPGQCPFVVKNIFELKNAQRVLLEGNVLENVWPGFSQQGESILLSGLNPAALPGATVYSTISIESVTIRYNRVAHTTGGMNIVNMAGQGSGTAPAAPNLPVRNVSMHDNVFDDMSKAYLNTGDASSFNLFNVSSCPICDSLIGISIRHNSVFSSNPRMFFILGSPQPQQLDMAFTDNIVTVAGGLVITANGTLCGNTGSTNLSRIAACLVQNYKFAGNVLIAATNTWPSGNYFPTAPTAVGFTNVNGLNGGDYTLLPASLYKGKATDGKDPGADIDAVNKATQGVN